MDKKFRRLYLHEIAFILVPQQLFCTKAKKYQGVKEKKHDFEKSMPSFRMCCTIIVHRSTNYEIMFLFTDPLSFHPFAQNHCYSIKLKAILLTLSNNVYLMFYAKEVDLGT